MLNVKAAFSAKERQQEMSKFFVESTEASTREKTTKQVDQKKIIFLKKARNIYGIVYAFFLLYMLYSDRQMKKMPPDQALKALKRRNIIETIFEGVRTHLLTETIWTYEKPNQNRHVRTLY